MASDDRAIDRQRIEAEQRKIEDLRQAERNRAAEIARRANREKGK